MPPMTPRTNMMRAVQRMASLDEPVLVFAKLFCGMLFAVPGGVLVGGGGWAGGFGGGILAGC